MPATSAEGITFSGLSAGYRGTTVLRDLTWSVPRGALVGIVGPSGAGKTTLVRTLTGQATRHGGEVSVLGDPVGERGSPHVGYVPQLGSIDWDFPLGVRQAVLLGATAGSRWVPWFSRAERRRADELLERLGLGALGDRHIRELSGGQQQRLFLARAMVRRCEVLLLDEPTSGVDLATRHDILHLVAELWQDGMTVLITTHDLNWVAAQLPRIALLNGSILADGAPDEVLTEALVERTYGARMRVLRDGRRIVVTDEHPVLGPRREDHGEAAGGRAWSS
ncbi:metal ABC transporter ATP-binding protein [Nitriliruptor alkaliphilus]|uniref:metal ABC transporter ATP-binding protein n=1 Tax=Nitriliruptor alkaliphilus TaxID=427918 RepID=UPI000697F83D|nr:ABC transporter ATP-binding protein [Nitriliruptor alkaliphilus]